MAEHFDGAIRFLYQRQPVDCDDRFIRQCGDAFNILAYKIEFLKTQIQENAQHISDIKEGSKLFHYITLLHRVTDAIDRMHEHIHVFYNELKDYGSNYNNFYDQTYQEKYNSKCQKELKRLDEFYEFAKTGHTVDNWREL
ncbi:hypothetical protein PAPYR_9818 [Paratrimastix pyriformis]|uniref:Uncharacterized protein n=1 Tax=Paratrimastix pyriformis TaxID=342808 RepID=A0ABQ8U668_9EUKA|nr:hypothetical protein PAPYR_12218 [Paratrimastix pyriformis]KAJ4455283.1 hypothetical protein PAPYR_9818 [Paratrimastix pyriformis]